MGLDAVVINNNPETVSTDYDACAASTSSRSTPSRVLDVIDHERALTGEPPHVVLTFGGQTAIDLAKDLAYADVPIAGLTAEAIETTEDRRALRQPARRAGPGRAARPAGGGRRRACARRSTRWACRSSSARRG